MTSSPLQFLGMCALARKGNHALWYLKWCLTFSFDFSSSIYLLISLLTFNSCIPYLVFSSTWILNFLSLQNLCCLICNAKWLIYLIYFYFCYYPTEPGIFYNTMHFFLLWKIKTLLFHILSFWEQRFVPRYYVCLTDLLLRIRKCLKKTSWKWKH